MVRHKPDNIEWQQMQTRKRILQEWKNLSKFVWFLHTLIHPWKQGKPSKRTYKWQPRLLYDLFDVIQVEEKFQFSLQKNWISFFSPCRVPSLLLSKAVYHRREEYEKTDVHETKKKPFKISVERHKNWGKKCKFRF